MNDVEVVTKLSLDIAAAIQRKDVAALAAVLAPDFVSRAPGGEAQDARAFLAGVRGISVEILSVTLSGLSVELSEAGALVTGIQIARVRADSQEVEDRRTFVDWFVRRDGQWRLRAAVDLPAP